MNTAKQPATRSRRHPSRLLQVLGIGMGVVAIGVVALLLALASYLRLSRDAGSLRRALMESSAAPWTKTIEIRAGSLTLHAVRAGLQFARLDPDARAALEAVRAAEVGVYQLQGKRNRLDRGAMLRAADTAMAARGWERLVGVVNRAELVAIYAPEESSSAEDLKICLVVFNGRELVVASARSNLEPLAQLALNHAERHAGWPVRPVSAPGYKSPVTL